MRRGGRIAAAAAGVLVFFALVEAALWAAGVRPLLEERDPFAGFSESVRVFETRPDEGIVATRAAAERQSFNHQQFAATKARGGFRLFTLGGSSAYGFPRGAGEAFTRILGEALRASYPGRPIEAVNAAAMSYGSHRLRILAGELAGREPDLFIVYEGHNEFVESRFFPAPLGHPAALDPLRAALHRWRLYSAMTRLLVPALPGAGGGDRRGASGGGPAGVGSLLGLDVAREDPTVIDTAERGRVREAFEENLRAIAATARAAGARLILCTVASNLRDWTPNRAAFDPSVPPEARAEAQRLVASAARALDAGDAAAAERDLEAAAAKAPSYAAAWFLLGRAEEAMGRPDAAATAYRRARDADAQPARAPGELNETIRKVSAESGAILVDIERLFERTSPHGLVGFDLIEDYVHPTPEGHRRIARALWEAILAAGLLGGPRPADDAVFAAALEAAAAGPGPESGGAPESPARRTARLFNMGVVLENQGRAEQALAVYADALAIDPTHAGARCNRARILLERGRADLAEREFRDGVAAKPDHLPCLLGLGEALSALGRGAESETAYADAAEIDPRSPEAWNGLGTALAMQGRIAEAEGPFRRAIAADPEGADGWANLGQALLAMKRTDAAIDAFREALDRRHDDPRARVGLAAALLTRGDVDAAEAIYRALLDEDPNDPYALRGLEEIRSQRPSPR